MTNVLVSGVLISTASAKKRGAAGALNPKRDRLRGSFLMMNGNLVTRLGFRSLLAYHRTNQSFPGGIRL